MHLLEGGGGCRQGYSTWEDKMPNNIAVEKVQRSTTMAASPANVARESKEQRVVVDSLFTNIKLSARPTTYTIVHDDVNLRDNPVAGREDQKRTHPVVGGGDHRTNCFAGCWKRRSEDQLCCQLRRSEEDPPCCWLGI